VVLENVAMLKKLILRNAVLENVAMLRKLLLQNVVQASVVQNSPYRLYVNSRTFS
jgi:hypothetical protein